MLLVPMQGYCVHSFFPCLRPVMHVREVWLLTAAIFPKVCRADLVQGTVFSCACDTVVTTGQS